MDGCQKIKNKGGNERMRGSSGALKSNKTQRNQKVNRLIKMGMGNEMKRMKMKMKMKRSEK